MTNSERQIIEHGGRRFLVIPHSDRDPSVFVRLGGKWSGGAVSSDDLRAVLAIIAND